MWRCTKVEQIANKGISCFTFAQDIWNSEHDYIERDENGKLVGIWCDYYRTKIGKQPEPDPADPMYTVYSKIIYSGKKPQLKAGGSFKKFSVLFYHDDEELPYRSGAWSYEIDGSDVASEFVIEDNGANTSLSENQIRIKIPKDDSYIGKILKISFTSDDGIVTSQDVEIVAL